VLGMDAYDRGARIAPAYLVFSPLVVLVFALALGTPVWWSKLGGVLAACGAPVLVVQWGRSGGRKKEPKLFENWGGAPTTKLLRFAEGGSRAGVVQRHEAVERATGIVMPSPEEEAADPATADATYETGVTALRELTRDEEQFPLVLKENIGYGFRRNLWGRKGYGIAVAVLVLAASGGLLVAAAVGHEVYAWESAAVAAAYAALALVLWITTVTTEWVHEAADAYAKRLLESALRLGSVERRL
jgi:hypothetical protein